MMRLTRAMSAAIAIVSPITVRGQELIAAPIGPPVRRIASATAISTEPLGGINGVRQLPGGRVLVNDGVRRRLILMDSTLQTIAVVLDSLPGVANSYGNRGGALIAAPGDSTLLVDYAAFSILVLDANGKVVDVRAAPHARDIDTRIYGSAAGSAAPRTDDRGRIIFQDGARPAPLRVSPPPGVPYHPDPPDSAFIVALDLDSRRLDTLGAIRTATTRYAWVQTADGGYLTSVNNPLQVVDAWSVLSDGVVTVVRGRDYHLELLSSDGKWSASPKIPFEWQRITLEDKERIADSIYATQQRAASQKSVADRIEWVNVYRQRYPRRFAVPAGYELPAGLPANWALPPGLAFPAGYVYACAPGGSPSGSAAQAGSAGSATAPTVKTSCLPAPSIDGGSEIPPSPPLRQVKALMPSEIPDYKPPFAASFARADDDGNLWIRTNPASPRPEGHVYDVVGRDGKLLDRIQVPPNYTLVGFGKDKVAYLSMRDAAGLHLVRVQLR